ncbi:MAG: hypothetical protein MH472_02925 [Bacteroidia bacterium]|nr:hypothetical protein [Bacteroidia bacterium]
MNDQQNETQNRLGSISTPFLFQYEMLIEHGDETCLLLNSTFTENMIDAELTKKCYGKIWFWVLGAYEFSRTLSEFKGHFSLDSQKLLKALKLDLALVRMPFAKQENKHGNSNVKVPKVVAESLIAGIDNETKDFVYFIDGKSFRFRELFSKFDNTVTRISKEVPLIFK